MELGHHTYTIYALHKVYLFFGYIPTTLNIDKSTLQGQIFIHRIKHRLTYNAIAKEIGLDKSTLARFERGKASKKETENKIRDYLKDKK